LKESLSGLPTWLIPHCAYLQNANHVMDAEKATGVKFLAKDGSRRDPVSIPRKCAPVSSPLTTDAQDLPTPAAFGKAGLDTQRTRWRFNGKILRIRQFKTQIDSAGGTLERDLPTARYRTACHGRKFRRLNQVPALLTLPRTVQQQGTRRVWSEWRASRYDNRRGAHSRIAIGHPARRPSVAQAG
jgi:hypothetical protein